MPQMPPGGPQAGPAPPPMPGPPPPTDDLQKLAEAVAWEDILEILKSGISRTYKIDIETDSTIRGDVRMNQQNATAFLDGTAKYMQSVAPMVQVGAMPMDVAIDLFASMARANFKLGKQAEDALSRWSHDATKEAKEKKNQPPPPSPEEIQAKMEADKMQGQMQMAQQKHGLEMQKLQAGAQADQAALQLDQQGKQAELAMKQQEMQMDAEQGALALDQQAKQAYIDFAQAQEMARLDMQTAERKAQMEEFAQRRKGDQEAQRAAVQDHFNTRKAMMAERQASEKHKRDMQKPRARAE